MKLYVALVLIGVPATSWSQTPATICEANPLVRQALQAADHRIHQAAATERAETTKLLAQDLIERYPEDFIVHIRYQQWMRGRKLSERAALIERYKLLEALHPGNAVYSVLYARALLGTDTPRAIELLKKAAGSPVDPWVHLTLADIDSFGRFADHAQARTHLDVWFAACPATLNWNAISNLTRYGSPETVAKEAATLRGQLANETDPYRLLSWEYVWNLEFKARPVSEHAALRMQIAADVARLETIPAPHDSRWLALLATGYKLAGSPEAQRRAEQRLSGEYPDSSEARFAVRERWHREHPFPLPSDSDEKKQAFYRAELAMADEQLKRAPDHFEYLMDRFYALEDLEGSSGEQVVAAGDAMLRASRKRDDWFVVPPLEFQLARALLKKKVEVGRVPDLVSDGAAIFGEWQAGMQDDRNPDEYNAPDDGNAFYVKTEAARILIDAARQLNKPQLPASAVAELESIKTEKAWSKSSILDIRGQFAEIQGHKFDALLFYRSAVDARAPAATPLRKDELAENVARLWKDLGGTSDAKELWDGKEKKKAEVAEGGGRWEVPRQAMSKWQLPDIAGNTWKLASLEGKTLLINLWSTSCGPCRAEHPYLEKLFQKVKGRTDIQILSFNIDDEIGAVAPYMKENGYTFPALLAQDYVNDLLPSISIPRNWIVDAAGKWRFEQIGFGSKEDWEQDILDKLEHTRP